MTSQRNIQWKNDYRLEILVADGKDSKKAFFIFTSNGASDNIQPPLCASLCFLTFFVALTKSSSRLIPSGIRFVVQPRGKNDERWHESKFDGESNKISPPFIGGLITKLLPKHRHPTYCGRDRHISPKIDTLKADVCMLKREISQPFLGHFFFFFFTSWMCKS